MGCASPYNSTPDTDSTFHLALIGEAKHHMPMVIPWITGEPLWYHWFVYPEMAASSWVTGIEPQVLLLRLSMLPMLMAFAVLVAVLARRVIGGWWSGVAASVLTLFVLSPNPYQWVTWEFYTNLAFSNLEDGSSLRLTVWSGPTQTFGALLFAAADDRAGRPSAGRGATPAAGSSSRSCCAGVMGAKATYLPLLFCGLLLVLGAELLFHRTLHRGALIGLGITFAGLVFSQVVLFGGTSQGTELKPLTRSSPGRWAPAPAMRRARSPAGCSCCASCCSSAGCASGPAWPGLLRRRLPEPDGGHHDRHRASPGPAPPC